MTQDEERTLEKTWGGLVARAWEDPDFEKQLLANPRTALADAGLEIPDPLDVRVVQGDEDVEPVENVLYLPYPPHPEGRLSDKDLDAVAGGVDVVGLQALDSSGIGERNALHGFLRTRITSLNPNIAVGGLAWDRIIAVQA